MSVIVYNIIDYEINYLARAQKVTDLVDSLHAEYFFLFFCRYLLTLFKINLFQKVVPGTISECQKVWIQIRTNALSS